jgi:DNA polymerase-1
VQGEVILVDGNSLIHRAYHALPPLATADGQQTNAVYGFTMMLVRLVEQERPDYLAVAFDKAETTFRNDLYDQYKAQRDKVPEDLVSQFDLCREVLSAFGIPYFEAAGFEADDLLGTLAAKAKDAGLKPVLVTGDRDVLQLVDAETMVMLTRRGITDLERLDPAGVKEKLGVLPEQVVDFKALTGDTSDNIPGVPGIGPKTAVILLGEYGSLEGIYGHLDEIRERWRRLLVENREKAFLSQDLARIRCDVPLEINWDACRFVKPPLAQVEPLFRSLQFISLLERLYPEAARMSTVSTCVPATDSRRLESMEEMTRLAAQVREGGFLAFLIQMGNGCEPLGLACSLAQEAVYVPWQLVVPGLKAVLEDERVTKVTYDVKATYKVLAAGGISLRGVIGDALLAGYLLNPSADGRGFSRLVKEYLNQDVPSWPNVKKGAGAPDQEAEQVLAAWVQVLPLLWASLEKNLKTDEIWPLYSQVELPLARVLAAMEQLGIKVDKDKLFTMGQSIGERMQELEEEVFSLVGEEFNLNSPRQLGVILFEKLGLPAKKKTKTGYSTDAEVLEELSGAHPVVERILEHRQLAKLKSTYVDAMSGQINPATGRIHTTFTQTVTATGRLSSVEPNLQNIPIRLELGRRLRQAFVPTHPDWLILAADYSQIELRVLAHMAADPVLQEAFINKEDIHTRTAAEIFHVPMTEVTAELRGRAKAVNFGIIYGISDFGLAKNTGVSRGEARAYIEGYFNRYQGVRDYMKRVVEQARLTGYVTTLLGRRRYLPDITSRNWARRSFAERTAMNTPIQGSAADIIKVAMLKVAAALKRESLTARMLLQVHDELVFETPREELKKLTSLVKQEMEQAMQLTVPLSVDIKVGPNWYEVKKV